MGLWLPHALVSVRGDDDLHVGGEGAIEAGPVGEDLGVRDLHRQTVYHTHRPTQGKVHRR